MRRKAREGDHWRRSKKVAPYIMIWIKAFFLSSVVNGAPSENQEGEIVKIAVERIISSIELSYEEVMSSSAREEAAAARALSEYRPNRWRSLGLSAQYQPTALSNAGLGEQQLVATLSFALGSWHESREAELKAEERSALAEIELNRLNFTLDAAERYLKLWERKASEQLVREHYTQLKDLLNQSLDSDGLSRLDRLELKSLLARQAALADEYELEWDATYAESISALGSIDLTVLDALNHSSDSLLRGDISQDSPWKELISQVSEHPILFAQKSRVIHLDLTADAESKSDPWVTQLGLGVSLVGMERWPMGTLSVSAPLSSQAEARARSLRHRAAALRAELERSLKRLSVSFITHDQHWNSVKSRVRRLSEELVSLYTQREELARKAFEQRHIEISRWVNTHIERISAELDLIHGQAHLWEAKIKASLILRAINQRVSKGQSLLQKGR